MLEEKIVKTENGGDQGRFRWEISEKKLKQTPSSKQGSSVGSALAWYSNNGSSDGSNPGLRDNLIKHDEFMRSLMRLASALKQRSN